ncbi:MAG TPA: hypothetical protein VFJ16_20455 [Longimicrobium sp.]|nr:hypothetical protein [Longimicrobium sp.]
MKARNWFALSLLVAPLALAACGGDSTGTRAPAQVSVRMGVSGTQALRAGEGMAALGGPLTVAGTNGTLSITGIQVVVAKFQLRGANDVPCAGSSTSDDECEFQAGPFFVDVPLDGSQLNVTTGAVPAGTYTSLRFRVKNLDLDDDDGDKVDDDDATPAQVAALFSQIRAQIPDWPQKASMLVTGTFTPTGGAPRTFRAFLRAEVKLTLPITPALTVAEGSTSSAVAVVLDPAAFFKTGTTVIDLSQFNGKLGEFKVEAGRAFHSEGHHGGDDGPGHT